MAQIYKRVGKAVIQSLKIFLTDVPMTASSRKYLK